MYRSRSADLVRGSPELILGARTDDIDRVVLDFQRRTYENKIVDEIPQRTALRDKDARRFQSNGRPNGPSATVGGRRGGRDDVVRHYLKHENMDKSLLGRALKCHGYYFLEIFLDIFVKVSLSILFL